MDLLQTYQSKLVEIGRALGYESRRSFKKSAMGDAVWLDRRGLRYSDDDLPIAAFKLLTFETEKEIREALSTIQAISPSLGVLVERFGPEIRVAPPISSLEPSTLIRPENSTPPAGSMGATSS